MIIFFSENTGACVFGPWPWPREGLPQKSCPWPWSRIFFSEQRWSPWGRPWRRGCSWEHILKSLASKIKSLASRPQVLENWPVLGSRTALFLNCWNFVDCLKNNFRKRFFTGERLKIFCGDLFFGDRLKKIFENLFFRTLSLVSLALASSTEVESRTQGSRPRTQKNFEAKAKNQGHRHKRSPKKKVFKIFFRRSLLEETKKRSLQIFRRVSGVFQRNFNGSKIVLSSSRGPDNFRGLEASRPKPRPRTSKCVLEAKDVLEDSTSARAFLSLASRGSALGRAAMALASDFFCVLGLGLEPCVLDSTSGSGRRYTRAPWSSILLLITYVVREDTK